MPPNVPDHSGGYSMRRSYTLIVLFLNNSPFIWYSNQYNTVESPIFGYEFVVISTEKDMVISMRYKLSMMVIPINL